MKLEGLTRAEVVALKGRLEAERRSIKIQLLRPALLGKEKVALAEEALEIKGKQINQINRFLQRKRIERTRREP
ncbi:MAG: hypothetical protein AMJ88_13720 [Anaerolineae bacterium SM23_ 63]|nr:MAG: hypothetical protein AMJ88_13720 [Anaerolineae bacterium SM23_ 63]